MNREIPACMAALMPVLVSGQARGVAFAVLSELAVPGSLETGGFGGSFQFRHIELSEDEADLAFSILDLPRDEILSEFHPRWAELTDPATTSGTLAGWFGLEAPQVIGASTYDDMDCICTEGGGFSCTSRSDA